MRTSTGKTPETGARPAAGSVYSCRKPPGRERFPARELKEMNGPPKSCWQRMELTNVGSPKGRESYGDRVPVLVAGVTTCQGGREGRPQGEGEQVTDIKEPERYAKCRVPRRCWEVYAKLLA